MPLSHRNYSYHHAVHRSSSRLERVAVRRYIPLKILLMGIIFVVVVAGITTRVLASDGGKQPTTANIAVLGSPKTAPEPPAPKRIADTSGLPAALAETIKKYPYDTSISVIDLNSGQLFQAGDTYPFLAASTTKLLTALLYLSNVETGQARLDEPIGGLAAQQQLEAMINKSDNNAWVQFNDRLNRTNLETYAKKQGLGSYDVTKNTINSNDMAKLMAKLYHRELLNDDHTAMLLSWMQNTSEERFIPTAVPRSSSLYHKSGYLEDRVHDVAIIDNGSTPFAIVIYSKSYRGALYNYEIGQKLFNDAATRVISIFDK